MPAPGNPISSSAAVMNASALPRLSRRTHSRPSASAHGTETLSSRRRVTGHRPSWR
jgi:hypothetical protein